MTTSLVSPADLGQSDNDQDNEEEVLGNEEVSFPVQVPNSVISDELEKLLLRNI